MSSGLWARIGPKNHVLDGSPDPVSEGAILGERGAHCKVSAVSCAKTAEPINFSFELWTLVGRGSISSIIFTRWRQCAQFQSYLPGGTKVLDDILWWDVQKWLNRTICCLSCGFGSAEGNTSSTVFARWHHYTQMGGHICATWRIRLNHPSVAAMRSYVKLLWPLVIIILVNRKCILKRHTAGGAKESG